MTRYLSPADIAERYTCKVEKVLVWLKTGELRGINTATNRNGRKPRWRIAPADLAAFEASRSTAETITPPTPRRRRAILAGVREYF